MTARWQFRDPARGRALVDAIAAEVRALARPRVVLMHVCGSHEQAIARYGLRDVLPPGLEVVMGPGCPVCVTDPREVDEAVALARAGLRLVTFGDMLRVPGSSGSLASAAAEGARVDLVYGPADGADLARAHPRDEVVLFACGFETTAAGTAALVAAGLPENLAVLSAHRYIPPAMEAVAGLPGAQVDAFLAAGHAAAITGADAFAPVAARAGRPVVVAGFEPLDLLAAILAALRELRAGRAGVVNAYPRAVSAEGNRAAQAALWRAFEPVDGPWRGLGPIRGGALHLRPAFAAADARARHAGLLAAVRATPAREPEGCLCGAIMTGQARPTDCRLFGRACTPAQPVGACMVSAEGCCRIRYQDGPAVEAA